MSTPSIRNEEEWSKRGSLQFLSSKIWLVHTTLRERSLRETFNLTPISNLVLFPEGLWSWREYYWLAVTSDSAQILISPFAEEDPLSQFHAHDPPGGFIVPLHTHVQDHLDLSLCLLFSPERHREFYSWERNVNKVYRTCFSTNRKYFYQKPHP